MSDQGPVIVKHAVGSRAAGIGMALIVLIAAAMALFAWHPWSTSPAQPAASIAPAAGTPGGN